MEEEPAGARVCACVVCVCACDCVCASRRTCRGGGVECGAVGIGGCAMGCHGQAPNPRDSRGAVSLSMQGAPRARGLPARPPCPLLPPPTTAPRHQHRACRYAWGSRLPSLLFHLGPLQHLQVHRVGVVLLRPQDESPASNGAFVRGGRLSAGAGAG